jgi:transposase
MKEIDKRTLKQEEQEEFRYQAVMLRREGKKYKEIGKILGVSYSSVCEWCKAYEREGIKGIQAKKRGRKVGSCRTLNADQEKQIIEMIKDKYPDQLKIPFALWTRIAVQQLVKQIWKIDMPIRTVGEYLNRWGLTPQKPFRKAYEQNSKAVKKWLDEQYPVIARRAKNEDAEIQWGDKTVLYNVSQHGRSYAPLEHTPAIRLVEKMDWINLVSSITNQGKVRFMIYQKTMSAKTFLKFVKRLIKDATKKIFLVLDNQLVPHSHEVKDWLENHKDEIELFFLPPYSP